MYVFCELCHAQRTSAEKKFHITSCCHIFCDMCSTTSSQCPVCKKPCRTTLVDKDLAPTLKEYLVSPTEQLTKIGKIYQFQMSKMDKFIEANLGVFQEYETSKKRIQKLKEMYEAYKKGIKEEQELIKQLQAKRNSSGLACPETQQSFQPSSKNSVNSEDFFSG